MRIIPAGLDVHGWVAFSSAEATWSQSPVTSRLPPAGLSKLDDIWQPWPSPIFPVGAQQCQGAAALLQPGQGHSWERLGCASTGP